MEEELWKPIPICSNYEASSLGRIRRIGYATILKPIPVIGKGGTVRYRFFAHTETGTKKVRIHRAVASAFIPNPENKPQVDHINGDTADNRVCNLRWATQSENLFNRPGKPGRTLPKGVSVLPSGRFIACFRGKHLGTFSTVEEAQAAYIAAGMDYCPEFFRAQ